MLDSLVPADRIVFADTMDRELIGIAKGINTSVKIVTFSKISPNLTEFRLQLAITYNQYDWQISEYPKTKLHLHYRITGF